MFAGNQVDDMHAAGPLETQYHFKNKAQRLLEGALQTRRARYINISEGDVRLEAVRGV
jgi:hypothetical protein